jgi:protein-tyrosine phosphatase
VIDLHAHVLPGFDDGVRSLEEARDLGRAAAAEGVTAIAATPHVRTDYPTTPEQMERGVERLRADFAAEGIHVEILHGGEVAPERLWELPDDQVDRFSLAGTRRYLLVEFPYVGWAPIVDATVRALTARGVTPLLAHPERNETVQARPERLRELVDAGALVQLTAGSIDGRLGRRARAGAFDLLELGLAHVVATDAHGPHIRIGGLSSAVDAIGDSSLAYYLTTVVPTTIVAGGDVRRR